MPPLPPNGHGGHGADALDPRLKPAPQGPPPDSQRPAPPVDTGQLVEKIPRRMRVAEAQPVEVHIARSRLDALTDGMQAGGPGSRQDGVITRAITLRLRAPEGGFVIESVSPETQWIDRRTGALHDELAGWRWTVTPQRPGKRRLQLLVGARTVSFDGLVAEAALPEHAVEVMVRPNQMQRARKLAGFALAATAGLLIGFWGEMAFRTGVLGAYGMVARFVGRIAAGG